MDDRDEVATRLERPASAPDTSPEPEVPHAGFSSAFDPPAGRFETMAELGRGGMGRVDEAFDHALGRAVAIKHMLHPTGTELARFEREARITARLEHPGIVPVHDAGRTSDGTPYYVMRRIDGKPLSEVVAGRTLDARLALVPNVLAACDAVAFAHARNIVHRDIKPTNILIGPFGETLIIDWGLARDLGDTHSTDRAIPSSGEALTRVGTVAGTPGFMSPEQSRGERVDQRADVFALGVTLFFVLAGGLPWRVANATEMVDHIGANRPPDWTLLPREVPADLRAIVGKAMAADARERYGDAGALAADLRRYITGHLVRAYEYGTLARIRRFVRRHRAVVAIAAVSLAVITLVAVISVRRVLAERDDARAARTLAEQRQRESRDIADALLVDNARQLASTDTLAAITTLRRLPPDSHSWRAAWTVAVEAYLHGVPYGFVGAPGACAIEIDASSTYALTMAQPTGDLSIIDLAHRSRRVVATLGRSYSAAWLDVGKTILVNTARSGAEIVDAESGSTKKLDIDASLVLGDRRSRALVLDTSGVVYEITSSASPREIARGVTRLAATTDLSMVLLGFRDRTEVRRDTQVFTLPALGVHASATLRDRTVVVTDGQRSTIWSMDTDRPTVRFTYEHAGLLPSVILGPTGGVFGVGSDGLRTYMPGGTQFSVIGRPFLGAYETGAGFAAIETDGSALVRDRFGFFTVPRRLGTKPLIDESPDARFVVLATGTGEILVYDLAIARGSTVVLEGHDVPAWLSADSLYAMKPEGGLARYPLAGGTGETLVESSGPLVQYLFDREMRWVAIWQLGGQAWVYDLKARHLLAIPGETIHAGNDGTGVLYERPDGTLARWTPGTVGEPPVILRLPFASATLAAYGDSVVAGNGHQVVRSVRAKGPFETVNMPVDVDQVGVSATGVAWIIGGGRAWRWPVGGGLVEVAVAEPIDHLEIEGEHEVLLHGSKSVIITTDDGRSEIVPEAAEVEVSLDHELIGFLQGGNRAIVYDRVSKSRIHFPTSVDSGSLIGRDGRLGYMPANTRGATTTFAYWDFATLVPREPAALRQWLATVTNAQAVPDSDAVTWPAQ